MTGGKRINEALKCMRTQEREKREGMKIKDVVYDKSRVDATFVGPRLPPSSQTC